MSMLEDRDFFPFIQPGDWRHLDSCYTRRLLPDSDELYIAYGQPGPDSNDFLNREALDQSGLEADAVHERAVTNLTKRHGKRTWTELDIGGVTVLSRTGDPYVSADVLNVKGLGKLHQFLRSGAVYVAIPTCFSFLACAHAPLLNGIVAGMYAESVANRTGPITPRLLAVANGSITGFHEPTLPEPVTSDRDEAARHLGHGLAAVFQIITRARGDELVAPDTFWEHVRKRAKVDDDDFSATLDQAKESYSAQLAPPTEGEPPVGGKPLVLADLMVGSARALLDADGYDAFAQGVLRAVITVGQAGTGFFGLGRKLPEGVQLVARGLGGVLGQDTTALKA
jgi:hypothetical protein